MDPRELERRLGPACDGSTYSKGGLNVPDLIRLAESKGHADARSMSRRQLLNLLCPKKSNTSVLVRAPEPAADRPPAVAGAGVVGEAPPIGRKIVVGGKQLKAVTATTDVIVIPPIKIVTPTLVQGGQVVQAPQSIQHRQVGQRPQPAEVEETKFALACGGKIKSEGGMDADQLQALAEIRGIEGAARMTRLELLHSLCPAVAAAPKIRITYKPLAEFNRVYPLGVKLGQGTYGSIYKSGIFAIKKIALDEAISELNAYATIYHPCINRPVSWSYDKEDENAYIAMPLGTDLANAYRAGSITIEQIISDTLSAIAHLNKLGVVHRDIKPGNMIFHDGNAKIIDMGLSGAATLFSDGKYRIKGIAYTPSHKDPEYVETLWNNISAETYALAKSYYDIIGHSWEYANMYSFKATDPIMPSYPAVTNTAALDWLFTEAKKPLDEKLTTYELLESAPASLIVRRHVGSELDTPVVSFNKGRCSIVPSGEISQIMVSILCEWLIGVAARWGFSARTLFAGLHLINRLVHIVTTRTELNAFGCMCMYLASIITGSITYISDWKSILDDDAYPTDALNDMLIDIMAAADCIIVSHTPWDYASCEEDLLPMLDDMIRCDYDPTHTRTLLNTGNTKDITSRKLRTAWIGTTAAGEKLTALQRTLMDRIPYTSTSSPHGVTNAIEPITDALVRRIWGPAIKAYTDNKTYGTIPLQEITLKHIAVLIRGRHVLAAIPQDVAISIYALLRGEKDTFKSAFARIFSYNMLRYTTADLGARHINPFTVTQAELDAIFGPRP